MRYEYFPKGVCPMKLEFDLDDDRVSNIQFTGGCNGNLKAISKLLEGQSAAEAVRILKGNDCNGRGTSCADQLAQAVEKALAQEQ